MSRESTVKDALESFLSIDTSAHRASDQLIRSRLTDARDLVEYIQLHYVDDYTRWLDDRRADHHARRRGK